jgi:Uma2 family endonuclease
MATRAVLTYADYVALPDDGRRYELHQGELSVTPAPGTRHQEVTVNLTALLHGHVKKNGLGKIFAAPTDCILSETTVVQPDMVYVDGHRLSAVSERGIEGPPALVIEVLSPSTASTDRGPKQEIYARHGVPYYWIVDPDTRTIEAYCHARGAYQLDGRLAGGQPTALPPFPELIIDPASVWP